MDEGQSALQVAIKNGGGWHDTRIISYLLDKGADVNFREDDKGLKIQEISCWPVLMDMAQAVYMNATELHFKMRPYYEKDNPYYGAVVSEERKQFFQELERLRDEEEKNISL